MFCTRARLCARADDAKIVRSIVRNAKLGNLNVHYFTSAYKAILRSTVTVFKVTYSTGGREIQNNNISSLGSNSGKKNTKLCHKTVIIFQCLQIRKLELVKILKLSWSTCSCLTEERLKNRLCMN